LIDTGSQYSGIDSSLLQKLQLVLVESADVKAFGAKSVSLYQAEIEIPVLGIREFTYVMVADIASKKQLAVLGRAQLKNCNFVYDGVHGTASLSRCLFK